MTRKVFIIGDHPIAENLEQQYQAKGFMVKRFMEASANEIDINDCDELCLLSSQQGDDQAVTLLTSLATGYDVEAHGGRQLHCHLLLQSPQTLQMLQSCDLCAAIRHKIDVYPFTMDQVWSRSIVVDYEPITIQSEKHAHVVIIGMGELAEMVAVQVALVAHFPNYVRDHSLRTRITMIAPDAESRSAGLMKRYRHLFDNSYYRIVKPEEENAVTLFHKPMYADKREDFVDVEWEFVQAESWNAEVRAKLQLWGTDERQLLTIVIATGDGDKNLGEALHLPNVLFERNTPIYIYSRKNVSMPELPMLHFFGMTDCGYDINQPLVRMAKNVNYIYGRCYEDNDANWTGQLRYSVEIDADERERSWAKLPNVKRMSSMYNAMTIPSKMRSIGLKDDDWDHFYDIPQQDIELLSQVEHNRWSTEELILGFRPCTDDEQDSIAADVGTLKNVFKARKIHYDLRAYNDLRPDGTGKPVQVYDQCLCCCLPLIAKAFADEEGGAS